MKIKEIIIAIYFSIAFLVFIFNFVFVSYGTSAYELGHDFGAAIFWPFKFIGLFF